MRLEFTKEIANPSNFSNQDFIEDNRIYTVSDSLNVIGSFRCSGGSADFEFDSLKYSIDINKNFWKNSEYKIRDNKSNLEVGKYFIPVTKAFNERLGTLQIKDTLFTTKEIKSQKSFSIFKPASWKYFSNKFYTLKISNGTTEIIYNLEIHSKKWTGFFSAEFSPASGSIDCSKDDLFIAFAGLFLVEQFFNDLDEYFN